jgi:hypothetical protein
MDSGSLRKDNHQAVRARWCRPTLTTAFSSTKATLFHRWLLSASRGTFVEHLNDIALDCREANLKVSASLHSNNQQIHRLKHAVWSHGSKGGHQLLQSISDSQQTYVTTMVALPRLPDCVFAFKRFKASYVERQRKRKISTAQSSDSSEHMMASSAKHSRPEIIDLTAVGDSEIIDLTAMADSEMSTEISERL